MENFEKSKNTAIVAYLTIVGSVIAIFMNQEENKSEFASFHIRQALGLFISFFLLGYFVGYANSWTATSAFLYFLFYTLDLWIFRCLTRSEKRVASSRSLFSIFF